MSPRTRALLHGPIVPTLLRMAWPNVLVMVAQAATGLIETWFVAKLGTDALAGMALVFPGVMLMQMISAGAMGGGISSAIARALGAGRRDQADALVMHALIINVALGVSFSVIMLAFGRPIYRALGGEGAELDAALAYSNVVFAGNVLLWVLNGFANVIRGTGNMLVPALVICVGVVVLIPLSPVLIFGLGPFPALGIAGGGAALLLFYAAGTAVLAWYILSGRNVARLRPSRLRWPLFRDILGVGAVAAVTSVQTNVIIALATALVAATGGAAAAAGYGTGGAAGISADPARVRARRAAGGDGRHQYRRRPARTRASHRDGGRGDRVRDHRGDRHCRGDLAAAHGFRCSAPIRACWRPGPAICASSGRPTDSSASPLRSISPRKAPAACSGRCPPASCACWSRSAAAGLRCGRPARCSGCSPPSRSGSSCMASPCWRPSAPAPGFVALPPVRRRSSPEFTALV